MKEKIILVTANTNGGIIQFTVKLYHVLLELGYAVKVFAPKEACNTCAKEIPDENIVFYNKIKKVIDKHPYKVIANQILSEKPSFIWYCDDSLISIEIGLHISNNNIKHLLTIHDAGHYHPTNRLNMRTRLMRLYSKIKNYSFYKKVYRFILLSPESKKSFVCLHKSYKNKTVSTILGAHIPQDDFKIPPEVHDLSSNEFFLFFGRIDKYKGISTLLKMYSNIKCELITLVIAGNGELSDAEKKELGKSSNVILINRYIQDGEMKWLFANSRALLLPYIEATQSGIIPIAYSYAKPVVVSDIPGLTQFVSNTETGYICSSDSDWESALQSISRNIENTMTQNIVSYYKENMNWSINIKKLLSEIRGNEYEDIQQ